MARDAAVFILMIVILKLRDQDRVLLRMFGVMGETQYNEDRKTATRNLKNIPDLAGSYFKPKQSPPKAVEPRIKPL